ncbi:MAG: PilZ domain-containing protein [Elusimicrobia bacterium]|jgi:c-di-GMP-binding flagellar brake protein YcgR|nr:PilZ domain-containing protein [Elusimicrobiota bacterium]
MKKEIGKEKRKHPRYPMGISLEIRAAGQPVNKCRGAIVDLSVGGMAFKTDALLEAGMSLYLKLNIPLEIRGEVRHMKGSVVGGMRRYGVRFHKIGYQMPDANKPQTFIAAQFQRKS